MSRKHVTKKQLIWAYSELVGKLAADIEEVIRLRGQTHYAARPDQQHEDGDVPEGAWERWADQVYDRNNRMGSYLADAEAIIKALGKYTEVDDEVQP